MKKGTQSTIQSSRHFSPVAPERRLEKTSSLKATESIIIGNSGAGGLRRKAKAEFLNRSIEEQIKKAKLLCLAARVKNSNCKTSREDSETAPSTLANFRERGKIIENTQIFRKLKAQQSSAIVSPSKLVASPPKLVLSLPKPFHSPVKIVVSSPKKNEPKPYINPPAAVSQPPRLRISSLLPSSQEPLHRLEEVRQIQSFVQQEEEEEANVSIVEGHGAGVLDWGVCMGKASEFRVLKFLDEGKYGKVYLAQSHRNNAIYSIKSIYRHALDEGNMKQLMREVKIQAFLNHPHVVRLYNFFVDHDSAYLVLQPCLGRNLYQNLKDMGKVPQKLVKEWIRQVCSAVQFMHKNDIIHRDLKPQNILLHENMIKICDFGWAIHSPLLRSTACGTPLYTPPQLVSGQQYDSKIDIWSIGILTYELLYGTIPFEIRHTNDMVKIIEQQVYFSHETLVSEAAKDFMMSCLHKNPSDRATINQLMDHEFLARMEKYRWTII